MANGNGYKTSTLALLGVVLTGVAAWLVFGQDKVTRNELTQMETRINVPIRELQQTVRALDRSVVRLNTILEER